MRCGARRKRRLSKDAERNPSEKEGCERIVKGTRILSRIYCMPGGWRKRLDFELVRGLRNYIERPCSTKFEALGVVAAVGQRSCSWATSMSDLSTSLLIARMNSARSATRDP